MAKNRHHIDDTDRKILSELVTDATQSYAMLGKKVNLSPPAVHERVKRMHASGIIRGQVALLDDKAIQKPLLVFIHLVTKGWGLTDALMELSRLPEFEELHSVTGDTCMILKVRLGDTGALESLLRRLHDIENVITTQTFVTLSTYLERPVQASITDDW